MIDQTHAHTFQGLTPKEELGVTLTHEHLFMDGSSCFELDDSEDAEETLEGVLTDQLDSFAQAFSEATTVEEEEVR